MCPLVFLLKTNTTERGCRQTMMKDMTRPGFARRMTREEINLCPIKKYEGDIHIIRTRKELDAAIHQLSTEIVVGFDTETRPAFKKGQNYPPALLQLAGAKAVYLFQLRHIRFPKKLRRILENPHIIKAGVALSHDISELKKIAPFQDAGFVDLAALAKKAGIKNHGLRGLAAVLLGFRISKTARQSNWWQETLTPAQILYAATDAWVGRELYFQLQEFDKWKGRD